MRQDKVEDDGLRIDLKCSKAFMNYAFTVDTDLSKFKKLSNSEMSKFINDDCLQPAIRIKVEKQQADIWKVLDIKDCMAKLEEYANHRFQNKIATFLTGFERENVIN